MSDTLLHERPPTEPTGSSAMRWVTPGVHPGAQVTYKVASTDAHLLAAGHSVGDTVTATIMRAKGLSVLHGAPSPNVPRLVDALGNGLQADALELYVQLDDGTFVVVPYAQGGSGHGQWAAS